MLNKVPVSFLLHNEFVFHYRADNSRDVFNEKPSKEELIAATQVLTAVKFSSTA